MIHGISHGLGVAVHDYVQAGPNYQVGDAFTIEPGIYISSKMLDVLPDTPRNRAFIAAVRSAVAKYDMTGVRIEDDYVITDKGLERMSTAPREIAEIEAIMAKTTCQEQEVSSRQEEADSDTRGEAGRSIVRKAQDGETRRRPRRI